MIRLFRLSVFIIPFISHSQVEVLRSGKYDSAKLELVFNHKGEQFTYDVLANNPYNYIKENFYKIDYTGNNIYNPDSVYFNHHWYTGNSLYFSSISFVHTAGSFAVVSYELIFNQTLNDEGSPAIDSYIVLIENGFEETSFSVDFGFYWPKISPNGRYIAFSRDEGSYTVGFKIYDVANESFIYEVDGSHNGVTQREDLFTIFHYAKEGGYGYLYCFDTKTATMYRKYFEDLTGAIRYGEKNSFIQNKKTYTLEKDFEKVPPK